MRVFVRVEPDGVISESHYGLSAPPDSAMIELSPGNPHFLAIANHAGLEQYWDSAGQEPKVRALIEFTADRITAPADGTSKITVTLSPIQSEPRELVAGQTPVTVPAGQTLDLTSDTVTRVTVRLDSSEVKHRARPLILSFVPVP